MIQLATIIISIGGDFIIQKIGIPEPQIYKSFKERKFIYTLAIYFVGNMIS